MIGLPSSRSSFSTAPLLETPVLLSPRLSRDFDLLLDLSSDLERLLDPSGDLRLALSNDLSLDLLILSGDLDLLCNLSGDLFVLSNDLSLDLFILSGDLDLLYDLSGNLVFSNDLSLERLDLSFEEGRFDLDTLSKEDDLLLELYDVLLGDLEIKYIAHLSSIQTKSFTK